MRLHIFNRHPRDEMSAYLDNELIPLRIEAMQAHLASCQSCRAELQALRQLKADLAALPEMSAPRSFALTPQMAARPLPEGPRVPVPPRAAALANGMRLAGAVMTLALALVLVLEFTGSGTTSNSDTGVTAERAQEIATASDSAKSFDSNSGLAPAADSSDLRLTPTPTLLPAATLVAQGGGVAGGPSSGESSGGISGYNASSPAASPAPIGSPGAAFAGVGETTPPNAVQTDSTITRSLDSGTPESLATSVPGALNLPATAGSPASESSGGADTLLIVALALAAGVVLTLAGSFVIPRLGREEL